MKKSILTSLIIFCLPFLAYGRGFVATPAVTQFAVGDIVPFEITITPEDYEKINALALSISADTRYLEPVAVSDGGTIITIWVDRPAITSEGTVTLSGVIPGGYSGTINPFTNTMLPGKVVTIYYKAVAVGQTQIFSNGSHVLLHDALGTKKDATLESPLITIDTKTYFDKKQNSDRTPPLKFEIVPIVDETIPQESYLISFNTTDSESGIAYYDMKIDSDDYKKVTSPVAVSKNASRVIVRAVDNAGNERSAIYHFVTNTTIPLPRDTILIVVGIVLALLYAFFTLRNRKK